MDKTKNKLKLITLLIILCFTILFSGCFNTIGISTIPQEENGRVPVETYHQDQHTEIVDLELTEIIAEINITINTSMHDTKVNISSPIAPVIGNLVCFKEEKAFFQADILAVTSLGGTEYQIELDSPLDYAFTTAGGCSIREDNWAVDGSVTPRIFSLSPARLNNVSWDITRVMLVCQGDGIGAQQEAPDMSDFFTMEAVPKGIVFRSVNGKTKNIFTANDNFHLVSETYDLTFYGVNRQGKYAVTSRRTFNGNDKNGVTIRLNSETSDRFDLIIQDDLTNMDECHAVVQGHVVGD